MPDGRSHFWVAKTTAPEGRGYLGQHKTFAIGLGCDLAYADRLVYSTGVVLDDIASAMRGHDVKDDVASSLTRWVSERVEVGVGDTEVAQHYKNPETWKRQAAT